MHIKFSLTLTLQLALVAGVMAQAPQLMNYQAVVRDAAGQQVTGTLVQFHFRIHNGFAGGTVVFAETDTATTNQFGLAELQIGRSTSLSSVCWGSANKYLQVGIDVKGGTNFTDMGTTQLLSMPYALYADSAANGYWTKNGNNIYNANSDKVGIGTNLPSTLLDVESGTTSPAFKLVDGTQAAGKVLRCDGLGNASWDSPTGLLSAGSGITISHDSIMVVKHYIGESYGGGIVFWVDNTGQHGLITATTDQSTSIQWQVGGNAITNAVMDSIGAGRLNTIMILINQGAGTYAAWICATYHGGGYGDWYLPSKYELNLMYLNIGPGNTLGLGNIGGFASFTYWSSTGTNNNYAWVENFASGNQFDIYNSNAFCIRAVRGF